jgi:hypothetical protein
MYTEIFFFPSTFILYEKWLGKMIVTPRKTSDSSSHSHSNRSETMVGLPRTENRVSHRQFSYMICELIPLWWVLSFWLEQKTRSSITYTYPEREMKRQKIYDVQVVYKCKLHAMSVSTRVFIISNSFAIKSIDSSSTFLRARQKRPK